MLAYQGSTAISHDQVVHFNTFGFLVLRQLFSPDEMAVIQRESEEIMAENAPEYDGTQSVAVSPFAERKPFMSTLVDDDRIYDIPAAILGHDFVFEGSGGHIHVGDTPWHGGSGVIKWPIPHIKVAFYFDSLNKDNGCLRIVPGSHRNYQRLVDSRWQLAPDYLEVLRNRNTSPDFRPFDVPPDEVPCMYLETEPGDVLVFTEDICHAAFGGQKGRYQVTINFLANPRTDEQLYYLKERYAWSDTELRPVQSYVNSETPRVRRMVSRLVELGFETAKL